jgi:SM-20-related protein
MFAAYASHAGPTSTPAALAPRRDLPELAARYAREARVVVNQALSSEVATQWLERIASWREWALVTQVEGQHRSFDAAAMDALPTDKRAGFDQLVARGAQRGFQYLYERYPLYDLGRAQRVSDPVLRQIYAMLRAPAFLDLARRLTGDDSIAFADGQITRYRRGHFLTLHDDRADGMQRVAAYVLNLTPRWAADFGGQLQFVDGAGQVEACVGPRFNALTVFRVPCPHLVSAVAPFVAESRYALTGWFHRGAEPALPAT